MITELLEQCDTRESRRATHHQTILSIIFSGLLQMVLANIEEARRSNYLITLPKFTAFIKYLSAGSGEQVTSSSSVGNNYHHLGNTAIQEKCSYLLPK